MKIITQAKRVQFKMAAAKLQVMELLGWDELDYCDVQYSYGLEYMQRLYPMAVDCEMLERSARWWGWWKMSWYLREQEWLDRYQDAEWCGRTWLMAATGKLSLTTGGNISIIHTPFSDKARRKVSYLRMHNIYELAECLNSYGRQMEDSYCRDFEGGRENIVID